MINDLNNKIKLDNIPFTDSVMDYERKIRKKAIDLFDDKIHPASAYSAIGLLYQYSPFRNEKVTHTKLFGKYIYKIKTLIEKKLYEMYNLNISIESYTFGFLGQYFEEYLLPLIQNQEAPEINVKQLENINVISFFNQHCERSILAEFSDDEDAQEYIINAIQNYSDEFYEVLDGGKIDSELQIIIDKELSNACIDYLNKKFSIDENINENNYINTAVPKENSFDVFEIFLNLSNRLLIDFERIIIKGVLEMAVSLIVESKLDDVSEEFEDLMYEANQNRFLYEDISETVKEKDKEINRLNNVINGINTGEKDKEITEVKLQLNKLQKKYDSLQEKYNNLKNKSSEAVVVEKPETVVSEDINNVDCNKRYVFVISAWSNLISEIQKEFPNSVFIESNQNINADATDMVILMTKRISHSVYHGIKRQCKDKNIPVLHCDKLNIKEIKGIRAKSNIFNQ